MTAVDCPHCDGDGWMLNIPELGPCVCVTPGRVQSLGAALLEAQDGLAELEGADEALATARAALAAYLVSIGLPAAPMAGLSPELAALLDALE